MKNNNKAYIYTRTTGLVLIAASLLLTQAGCSKNFLEVPSQGQQASADFWKTQDDVTKGVNATYANLRVWNNTAFAPIAVESMGSDDAEKGGGSPADANFMSDYDNFVQTSTQGQVGDFWAGQYQNIYYANQVLDHIDTIPFTDNNLKERYKAEVKFIRAYSYFRLVRAFGAVPYRIHIPQDPKTDYNLPRTSKDSIYALIEQDLTDAAAVLPQSYGTADIGRATKGAALGMHAKVCMYLKKWQDCLNYSNLVMGLGYSLFPNYEQQFRIANENNSESVFEIQCTYFAGNNDASNSQYSQVQGDPISSPTAGWGFNRPTKDLAAAYEPGDPRMDATILFPGETTPEGDLVPIGDSVQDNFHFKVFYNQKSYVPFVLAGNTNQGADQDVRVLRYAEILLINAEAANELGQTTQALSSLELVRARARNNSASPGTTLPPVTITDQSALRSAIWKERRVELAMEFDRFFDVIRQGRGAEVFGPKGFKTGKNELMPIPQTEIDLSGGVLTQNPGY